MARALATPTEGQARRRRLASAGGRRRDARPARPAASRADRPDPRPRRVALRVVPAAARAGRPRADLRARDPAPQGRAGVGGERGRRVPRVQPPARAPRADAVPGRVRGARPAARPARDRRQPARGSPPRSPRAAASAGRGPTSSGSCGACDGPAHAGRPGTGAAPEPRRLHLAPDQPRPRPPADGRSRGLPRGTGRGRRRRDLPRGHGGRPHRAADRAHAGRVPAGDRRRATSGWRARSTPTARKLFVQLFHGGREQISAPPRAPAVAPSAVPSPRFKAEPRALTAAELRGLLDGYRAAARHCRDGGVDGIEVSMSHGYLIAQFFSPRTNRRADDHAAPLRFATEVLGAVREAAGPELAVGVRLSARTSSPPTGSTPGAAPRSPPRSRRPGSSTSPPSCSATPPTCRARPGSSRRRRCPTTRSRVRWPACAPPSTCR